MTYLLDVNVLIALIDPMHVAHEAAHRWFAATGAASWATCPMTENGVIRIVGHPKYPNTMGSPAAIAPFVVRLRRLPGHVYWRDGLSLADDVAIDPQRITTPRQVTDTYLLALAVVHGGQLATFDRRLSVAAVHHGRSALHLIEDAGH